MNTFNKIIFFFFIQIVVRYLNAAVTENTVCDNGYLVQMSGHIECRCNEGFVLLSENTCEQPIDKCEAATEGKSCGNYEKCNKNAEGKYECVCRDKYSKQNGICVPTECKDVTCDDGKCIANEQKGICSCNIGKVLDIASNKCIKEGETVCTLKCTEENTECSIVTDVYKCDCANGFVLDNESKTCVAFSLFNMLNMSIIFIISLICFYVI